MSMNPRFQVGELVYPGGTSGNRIGVVRAHTTLQLAGFNNMTVPALEIEWMDGKRTVVDDGSVWPIDNLIDDHLGKLNTHLERRDRAARRFGVAPRGNGPVQL